ncbi:hypothetical protein ON010_g15153 [Phytophthora cinnamomi]|nr:hypothetical protein ON010_g15153 [Phytophthora cinnamomi]
MVRNQIYQGGAFCVCQGRPALVLKNPTHRSSEWCPTKPLCLPSCSAVPDFDVLMDASDVGLCAAFPDRKEYLLVNFDAAERAWIEAKKVGVSNFDINVHELLSAVVMSGFTLTISQTSLGATNISAATTQQLLRVLGLLEVKYNFYSSAEHVPGSPTDGLEKTLAPLCAFPRSEALMGGGSSIKYHAAWNQWLRCCKMMNYSKWLEANNVDQNAAKLGAFAVYLWRYGMNRKVRAGIDMLPIRAQMTSIMLTGANNNQYGREERRFLHRSGDSIICPILAARWIKKAAKVFGTGPHDPALSTGRGILNTLLPDWGSNEIAERRGGPPGDQGPRKVAFEHLRRVSRVNTRRRQGCGEADVLKNCGVQRLDSLKQFVIYGFKYQSDNNERQIGV